MILDPDGERATAVAGAVGGEARAVGIGDPGLPGALKGSDAVAACIPYRLNLEAMEAALEARVPYADLGGLFHMTLRQLELDARFLEAGVPAVLGIGCCSGISNVLARLAADRLDEVRSVDIVDGAVEVDGGFGVPYSADTILDELTQPAVVFEDGEMREVPAASGAIRYLFPEPLGEMEAFYTLHSEPATLPDTIEGVQDVRWRLALPPKIADGFRVLVDLGLASEELLETPTGGAVPREVLRALLAPGCQRRTGLPAMSRCWMSTPPDRWAAARPGSSAGPCSGRRPRASGPGRSGHRSLSLWRSGGWPTAGSRRGPIRPSERSTRSGSSTT
ncbi:MAG: saccharopine dehydrogenase family protein [Actinomycetota bacterium]